MPSLTEKKATSRTPQVVTLVVDDSGSMQESLPDGKSKAQVASDSLVNLDGTRPDVRREQLRASHVDGGLSPRALPRR